MRLHFFSVLVFYFVGICCAQAQDWQVVRWNQKLLYALHSPQNDFSFVVNAVDVDTLDSDYHFSMRRYGSRYDTIQSRAHYWIDVPAPFGTEVTQTQDLILVKNPMNLVIKKHVQLGEIWLCDSLLQEFAEVVALDTAMVFGEIDSVYRAELDGGRTLVLSKHHGLLEWFTPQGDLLYLVGSHGQWGVQLPSMRDIYSFSVGDVFEYSSNIYSSFDLHWSSDFSAVTQRTIRSKSESNVSISYTTEECVYYTGTGVKMGCTTSTLEIPLFPAPNQEEYYFAQLILNKLENEVYNCSTSGGTIPIQVHPHRYTGKNLYRYQNDCSIYSMLDMQMCYNDFNSGWANTGYAFSKNMGMVYHMFISEPFSMFTDYKRIDLVGYRHNGVTYGHLHEKDYFFTKGAETYSILGNEFTDELHIADNTSTFLPFSAEIFDALGRLVYFEYVNDTSVYNTLQLGHLKPAVYVLRLTNSQTQMVFRIQKSN